VQAPDQVSDIDHFDGVIVGSAVYMGHWLEPARKLVDRISSQLPEGRVWLFSSGPVGEPSKPADNPVDVSAVVAATNPKEHQLFGGKLDKKWLSFGERAMAAALRVDDGDHRDWEQIERWAAAIADELANASQ